MQLLCTGGGRGPGWAQLGPRVVGKGEVVHDKVTELFVVAAVALDLVILKCHKGFPTLGNLEGGWQPLDYRAVCTGCFKSMWFTYDYVLMFVVWEPAVKYIISYASTCHILVHGGVGGGIEYMWGACSKFLAVNALPPPLPPQRRWFDHASILHNCEACYHILNRG